MARQPGTLPVLLACASWTWAISKVIVVRSITTKPSPKSPTSSPKSPESSPQQFMSAPIPPVLRLRATTEREELEEEQLDVQKFPDGPWRRHPDEIDDSICALSEAQFPLDISIENYRIKHRNETDAFRRLIRQWPKSERRGLVKLKYVSTITQLVDMEHMQENSEDNIEDAIEQSFVYCDTYGVDANQDHMLT